MDEKTLGAVRTPPEVLRVPSVYVHAPFCAQRCFYCDFAVHVSRKGDLQGWISALRKEMGILETEGVFRLADRLETVFVGGGTPSVLGRDAMAGLAEILGPDRLRSEDLEWTVEANPESFSEQVAGAWARAGVTRLSFGAQSFQESALRWMGRLHGPNGPAVALERARAAGIENLSLDLIFGLPDEVHRDWRFDLDSALALGVPHLSLYGLTVEAGTPLGQSVSEGRISPPDEARYRDEFLEATRVLAGAGYHQYELSNFALPGFEARHNLVYWGLEPYLGLGNSAHSYRFPLRRWNTPDWGEYREALENDRSPLAGSEVLDPAAARLERLWLCLRTDAGVPMADLTAEALDLGRVWVEKGWAMITPEALRLTPAGWLLLDRLAVEMDLVSG